MDSKKKYLIDDFSIKESWRLFRILAEFVEGFDSMAGVGPAVTFFGSAQKRIYTNSSGNFLRRGLRSSPEAAPGSWKLQTGGRRRGEERR